ncbi:helix-turn-helix domain-containing protein [candidate division KSB1 bacterium]
MGVGERIRMFRKESGMTLDEVAKSAGMQASNLSDIEKGKRDIRTQTLERIAAALRVAPSDLIGYRYETDEEMTRGLRDLIDDEKTRRLMSITDREIEWMRTIRFRPDQSPSKQDYIDLLFLLRNIK